MINKTNYIVDSKALMHNVHTIRSAVGSKVKICAIVKANAYGMGMPTVVNTLKGYVDYFGVASVYEAQLLREVDNTTPVLILGEVNLDNVGWCADNGVDITVSNIDELYYIANNLIDKVVGVHLAVNTGLNRIGFRSILQFTKAIHMVVNSPNMKLSGVFSHFATKANDTEFMRQQYDIFMQFARYVPSGVILHIANSFASMGCPQFRLNMVRPGFAMYGEHKCKYDLHRVLSITSEIIHITHVRKGESIGYDRTCVAEHGMQVAVVPIGYADGLDRRLSNKGYLLVGGKRAKIVGNICMDVVLIDVTYIPHVFVGSKVTILGVDGAEEITPYTYANLLGTSPYEILLKFNYRRMNYIVT